MTNSVERTEALADTVMKGILSGDPEFEVWRECVRYSEEGNGPFFHKTLNDLWIAWQHAFTVHTKDDGPKPIAPVTAVLASVVHMVAFRLKTLAEDG